MTTWREGGGEGGRDANKHLNPLMDSQNEKWILAGQSTFLGTCAWSCVALLPVCIYSFLFIICVRKSTHSTWYSDSPTYSSRDYLLTLSCLLCSVFPLPDFPSTMLFCLTVVQDITTDSELEQFFLQLGCLCQVFWQWCSLTVVCSNLPTPKMHLAHSASAVMRYEN